MGVKAQLSVTGFGRRGGGEGRGVGAKAEVVAGVRKADEVGEAISTAWCLGTMGM